MTVIHMQRQFNRVFLRYSGDKEDASAVSLSSWNPDNTITQKNPLVSVLTTSVWASE